LRRLNLNRASGLILGALLLFLGASCTDSDTTELAPRNAGINVLLITVDTLRPDHMSAYGYPRDTTPAIAGLASRGVLFETAFTYWPKTRGSFAAMFTSLYASQHGLTVRDRDLPYFNQTLAETFQAAGYRTAAAVDNGNLDRSLGFAQGFSTYEQTWAHDEEENELDRTERITSFAEEFLRQEDDAPFFLWLHYVNPHTPYEPPQELLDRFRGDGVVPRGPKLESVVGYHGGVNRKMAVEGEEHWGDYIDRYDAEILAADVHVGRALKALDESPYPDSTIVVFTSDHGESLGEHDYFFDHGFDLFNPSLRIPLILSFPGFLPSGERVGGHVSNLDIFPTILDLAQVSFPPSLQGRSLLPLVRGTENKLHERLFFQNDQHQIAISNGRLKLVHYPEGAGSSERYELYEMYGDPGETENRYQGAEERIRPFEAELSSFRTQSLAWQQATSAKRAGADATTDSELSEQTLRSLKALGYIDDSAPEPTPKKTPDR
jgi:arylsulfatase A-like enzyme